MDQTLFPVGERADNENFSGAVWLKQLTPAPCAIYNVTFAPGCRNSWHEHMGGQHLLVTDGRGWYQEEGMPARALRPGDVVVIPARVKHWHGAAKDSVFSHLAVEVSPEKGPARWLEPVADEVYDTLDETAEKADNGFNHSTETGDS